MTKIAPTLYKKILKPILFAMSPDRAHGMIIHTMRFLGRVPGFAWLVRKMLVRDHPELQTEWRGMKFSSPVGLAAGIDKNGQVLPMMQAIGFGFTETGSVTAEVCYGNPRPWFYRLPETGSLVVHVGLANHGVKKILARLESLPLKVQKNFPTILSIARTNSKEASGCEEGIIDYITSLKATKKSPAVQMVEVNISCPNAYGGQTFTTPELLEMLLFEVDKVKVGKPVFVKMPVDLSWPETKALLDVIVKHDVAGVTMTNLTKQRDGRKIKDDLPESVKGGLSGALIRERSTALVRKTYKAYGDKLTIIGVGGVMSAEQAYEKIRAGATFVEIATGIIMNGPFLEEVNSGLVELLKKDGFSHISEAVGADHS